MVFSEYLYPSEKHGLKEDHGNADHLRGGLDLAEPACRDNGSVTSRDDESERRYRKLTEHDDRRSPQECGADIGKSGCGAVIADKYPEERGKYDELIREGIHELAEIRYKVVFARDLSVDKIGKRREDKHSRRGYLHSRRGEREHEQDEQDRYKYYAKNRKFIRQIHFQAVAFEKRLSFLI